MCDSMFAHVLNIMVAQEQTSNILPTLFPFFLRKVGKAQLCEAHVPSTSDSPMLLIKMQIPGHHPKSLVP